MTFKEIKSKNSAFKELRSTSTCDPDKLKKHFEHHFNTNLDKTIPLELHEADFINTLKEIPSDTINDEPLTSEEIKETIEQLKQGKSASDIPTEYIQAAIENPIKRLHKYKNGMTYNLPIISKALEVVEAPLMEFILLRKFTK